MGWIADLLKEIPSAARYKAELEEMEKENAQLKSRVSILESDNANFRQEIQQRDNAIENEKSHLNRLPEEKEKLLVFIAQSSYVTSSQIARHCSISKPVVEMHIEDLQDSKYIDASYAIDQEHEYYLQQSGRKYLHKNGLI